MHPLFTEYHALISIALLFTFFKAAECHEPDLFVAGGTFEDRHNVAKYVVSIQERKYITKYFGYFHICGGSIIGKRKILTATHCLVSSNGMQVPVGTLVVVVGIRNRFKPTSKTRVMYPSRFITHDGYDLKKAKNTANDVGLIILKESIDIDNDMIAQIALPTAPVAVNQSCVVAGWGRVFHNGPLPAEITYAEVQIFSPAECREMNRNAYSSKMICAGDRSEWKSDTCKGDSGGPLVCEDRVVGIVSSGYECASVYSPGMYTDVYQFLKWIESCGKTLFWNHRVLMIIIFIHASRFYTFL